MKRTAIISPHSMGALSAYRMIIKDISRVLGDPAVDVAKLFFAVMIQAGLHRFDVLGKHYTDIVDSDLIADRVRRIDGRRIEAKLHDVRSSIRACQISNTLAKDDQRRVEDIIFFLQEMYIAAEFRRPLVSVTRRPDVDQIPRLFRDDMAIVLGTLFRAIEAVDVQGPLMRLHAPYSDLAAFREVVASDLFDSYVEGHTMFERVSGSGATIQRIARAGRAIVRLFPDVTELKETTVLCLDSVPAIVEAKAGKALGSVAKPLISALSRQLSGEHRLMIYSFDPTWRRLWDSKLDKVRVLVEAERSRTHRRL